MVNPTGKLIGLAAAASLAAIAGIATFTSGDSSLPATGVDLRTGEIVSTAGMQQIDISQSKEAREAKEYADAFFAGF